MRKPLIAGNWKLNNNIAESVGLATAILDNLGCKNDVDIVIAPVFTAISAVAKVCTGSNIKIAGQNCHCIDAGAFTGEVSAPMLADAGCNYVILGHSERRQLFGETDCFINAKCYSALQAGLIPILCVGETEDERDKGEVFDVITRQITLALNEISQQQVEQMVIAYEPIWAIGTGKTATSNEAAEVHSFIRGVLSGLYSEQTANSIRIVYGGSVKPNNIAELMVEDDIDGALVGGASLKAADFSAIVNFPKSLKVAPR
ncbi:MAG: triose-phosphate isomerase [Desulfobacteraceae bacterium 4572_35.1]|nr:MAG: triose-phosphate isomerase [Desulfobacteraceae bacterium 4572_35.1]